MTDFVPTEASISSTELEEPNHVEGSGDHLTNVVPSSTHPYPPGPVEEPSTPPTVRIPGLEFPLPGARASLRLAFVLPNVIRDDFGNPGDYSSPAVTYPVYPSGVLQNAGQIVLYCGLILPPIIFIGSLIVPPVDGVFAGFGWRILLYIALTIVFVTCLHLNVVFHRGGVVVREAAVAQAAVPNTA